MLERENGDVIDAQYDVAFAQTALVLLALLPYQSYHRMTIVGHEGNVGLCVADVAMVAFFERLEYQLLPLGVDDEMCLLSGDPNSLPLPGSRNQGTSS